MEDLSGKRIDKYEITGLIASGGMAYVYRAIESTPNYERFVALKLINTDNFPPKELPVLLPALRKRFKQEAQIMAHLKHPHIVKVFDSGNCEGAPYIVMELIEGETLEHKLGKPIPYSKAAEILIPIADALFYLHKQQKVHRDVKPANIMIQTDGSPILMDFGIAKALDDTKSSTILTRVGSEIGTPDYMAPEQVLGDELDGRADEYALGVILFEMITGRKLYYGHTSRSIELKHVNEKIPSARDINPEIPEEVDQLIQKVLAKDPNDRFPTIEDFAVELSKLAGQPVQSSQVFFNEDQPKTKESGSDELASAPTVVSPLSEQSNKGTESDGSAFAPTVVSPLPEQIEEDSESDESGSASTAASPLPEGEENNLSPAENDAIYYPLSNTTQESKIYQPLDDAVQTDKDVESSHAASDEIRPSISDHGSINSKHPYWLLLLLVPLVIAGFFAVRYFTGQYGQLLTTEMIPSETTAGLAVIIPTGTPEQPVQTPSSAEDILAVIPVNTNTAIPTATGISTAEATNTPLPTATDTSTATSTNTPLPTVTDTPTEIANPTMESLYVNAASFREIGAVVEFGAYEQDNNTSNGKETIEWVVLDVKNNHSLLLSRYGLDSKPYNNIYKEVTWENSYIRDWLNDEFLNDAFSVDEQKLIRSSMIVNTGNKNTDGGGDTNDKIFLLSVLEVNKYFNNDTDRKCTTTSYAHNSRGATWSWDSTLNGQPTVWWWLRTPGNSNYTAAYISPLGGINLNGYAVDENSGTHISVRPALWINLEKLGTE